MHNPYPMSMWVRWRNLVGWLIDFTLRLFGIVAKCPSVGGDEPLMTRLLYLEALMTPE